MNRIVFSLLGLSSLCGAALFCGNAPQRAIAQGTKPNVNEKDFRAFLDKQCYTCHDSETKKGDLALDKLKFDFDEQKNFDLWLRVFDRVDKGEMPPPNKPQPAGHDRAAHMAYLRSRLLEFSQQKQAAGRTVLRRLNRVEYENTLHDLLDIDTRLQESLPEDASLHGFDTVADGLRLSQLHIEKFLEAADLALDNAIRLDEAPVVKQQHFVYKEQEGIVKQAKEEKGSVLLLDDAAVLFTDASYITKINGVNFRESGLYKFRASGYAYQSEKPIGLVFYTGSYKAGSTRILGNFDMPPLAPNGKAREIEWTARVEAGEYFYPAPDGLEAGPDGKNVNAVGAKNYTGSGLALQWVDVEGPLLESWPPPSVKLVFGDTPVVELDKKKQRYTNGRKIAYELAPQNPKEAIRSVVERFATRAFRRPLEAGEVDGFIKLAEDSVEGGASFETAVRAALRGVLVSPAFLLFEEKTGPLDDYALASRLSYFLWSTMPDAELLNLAAKGELHKPEVLRAQTERLLKSPKNSLARNFAGQWLELRNIDATTPDKKLYPEFDDLLKISMVTETESFFNEMLRDNLSVSNFINSDWTILNRKLAEHYGIFDVKGEQFRRVSLPADSPRGGLLTQAAVLKVTANGTTTSPVLRGAWVLKHILGTPPAPPPPGVGSIEPDTRGATTVREQLDKHRTLPTCNSCHRLIDPPGFALESFDVIGGYRERYRSQGKGDKPTYKFQGRNIYEYKIGLPVDASGELTDGRQFTDVRDFKKLLLEQQDQIARALAGQLLTYATGAGVQFSDRAVVEEIVKNARKDKLGLRSMVHEVVQSKAFRKK